MLNKKAMEKLKSGKASRFENAVKAIHEQTLRLDAGKAECVFSFIDEDLEAENEEFVPELILRVRQVFKEDE